jgi:hypothetical protein
VSSGRKPRSARAQRREEERRESARYQRLYARAHALTYEPPELDQAIGAQPQLLDTALMGRYATRRVLFSGCRELLRQAKHARKRLVKASANSEFATPCRIRVSPTGQMPGGPLPTGISTPGSRHC